MLKRLVHRTFTVSYEIFVGLNFRYQAMKAYFRGLIFVLCPEHIIIVAFRFGGLRNKNNEIKNSTKISLRKYTVHIELAKLITTNGFMH